MTAEESKTVAKISGLERLSVSEQRARPIPIVYLWALFSLILAILSGAGGDIARVFVTSPSVCEVAGSVANFGGALHKPVVDCLAIGKLIIDGAALTFFGSLFFLAYAVLAALFSKR